MHAWEQIQEAIDYIEENLSQEINIETLAKNMGLSQFYFQRLFHQLVKKPVIEYVKCRRMAVALDLLKKENKSILDIALELGFKTHEHFSRTFKNTYGLTPSVYRKNSQVFNKTVKPELILNYYLIEERIPLITDGIVIEIARQCFNSELTYIGFIEKLPLEYGDGLGIEPCEDVLCYLWDKVHTYKQMIDTKFQISEEIGVVLPCSEEGYYNYFAGIPADIDCEESIKNGIEHFLRPKGEYIVCTFEAENFELLVMDALYKAQRYLFEIWLPNNGLSSEAFCIEYYENHTPNTTKMQLLIKLKEA